MHNVNGIQRLMVRDSISDHSGLIFYFIFSFYKDLYAEKHLLCLRI